MRPAFYNLMVNKIPEPDFDAPLIKSAELRRGYGTYTFSRNSTATVWGYALDAVFGDAQVLLTVDENEQRFEGLRRISSGVWDDKYADGTRISYDKFKCYLSEGQRINLFLNSNIGTTQSITVTAQAYTLSFWGTGSVVLSGAATGTLNGTGANDRVSLTFTPSSGSVTLTVTGSVLKVNFEAGAFSSSYIPTTSASVTRNADVLTYPMAENLNSSAGTGYTEYAGVSTAVDTTGGKDITSVNDGTTANFIRFSGISSGASVYSNFMNTASVLQANITGGALSTSNKKFVTSWSTNNVVYYEDGVNRGSDTSATMPTTTQISIGGIGSTRQPFGTVRNVMVWKRALKNRQLTDITK